jgi:two-component system, chemotaxis family, chemotaxis protein CheY
MSDEKTILLVDDSPAMRQLLRFAVKRLGLRCLEAGNGEEAIAALGANAIDMVVCDINMPVMDGFTFLRILREHPKWKALPIVMVTTEGDTVDRERAMKLGANAYLTKPIQAPSVVDAVRKHLELP